jgi:predicted DCC family thiol-disulfide oxidoreductase YuxK
MSPESDHSADRWTVLYDDDCGVCRALLGVVLSADLRHRLRPVALQSAEADALLSDLTPEQRMASWHLISPNGVRRSAGAALPTLASLLPGGRLPSAGLAATPGLNRRGYEWVADHRSLLGRFTPASAKRRADRLIAERRGAEPTARSPSAGRI